MIIGHDRARTVLDTWDWPVVLLLGPDSVGKFALAREAMTRIGRGSFMAYPRVTSEAAREIQDRMDRPVLGGGRTHVLLDLDEASPQACNQLLKTLEEPPGFARFVLTSSGGPLLTIASRAILVRCGLLTTGQVEQVLLLKGMSPEAARKAAPFGGGRVIPAMVAAHDGPARARVSRVLRSLAARDNPGLTSALREWDDAAHELLEIWAGEAACQRWRTFDAGFAPGLGSPQARQILGRLAQCGLASAPLAAAAALLPLCPAR